MDKRRHRVKTFLGPAALALIHAVLIAIWIGFRLLLRRSRFVQTMIWMIALRLAGTSKRTRRKILLRAAKADLGIACRKTAQSGARSDEKRRKNGRGTTPQGFQ